MRVLVRPFITDADIRERDLARMGRDVCRRECQEAARHGFIDAQAGKPSRALHLLPRRDIADAYQHGFEFGKKSPLGSENPF